jgi:hypothetical protein
MIASIFFMQVSPAAFVRRVVKDLAGLVPVFRLLIAKWFQILVREQADEIIQPAQQRGNMPVCCAAR